jgi:FlaA1/EpsC-like NDP-sugar epimerase
MISKQEPIKIVIVGSGGFGREVLWTLRDCNKKLKKYEILGFIDDDKLLKGKNIE